LHRPGEAARRPGRPQLGRYADQVRRSISARLSAGDWRILMKPVIVREIRRPKAGIVRTLGELGVATVHEAQGRTGLMRPFMRPIYASARVAGPAVTVLCHPGEIG